MGTRRFSLTTYVLVGLSLGALYFVGRTVTPPPAAPPQEVAPASAVKVAAPQKPSPDKLKLEEEKDKAQVQARTMAMKAKMVQTKNNPAANVKTFNPNMIDVESKYWQDPKIKPGLQGEQEMTAKVEAAKKNEKPNAPTPQTSPPVSHAP